MKLAKRFLGVLGMTIFIGVVISIGVIILGGCKKSHDTGMIPAGLLLETSGCKEFVSGAAEADRQSDDFAPGPHNDCIEYQYNGTDTLILTHNNAGFNCCPGQITAEIVFNGKTVTIAEKESKAECHCLCLYDLDYLITNLEPGEYTLRFVEPYIETGDQVLQLTLSLSSAASGNFCLPRNHYPWQ